MFHSPLIAYPRRTSRRKPSRSHFLDFLESRQLLSGDTTGAAQPVVTDIPETGTQEFTIQFKLADFLSHFSDSTPGASLQSITIAGFVFNGVLLLNGLPVGTRTTFAASDIPDLAFNGNVPGIVNIPFTASDGNLSSNVANITFILSRAFVGGYPPGIQDSSMTGIADNSISLGISDFHSQDITGRPSQFYYFQVVSLPSHGMLLSNGTPVTAGQGITTFFDGESSAFLNLTYVPTPGYSGTDSFLWNAANVFGFDNRNATLSITLTPPPVAIEPPTVSNAVTLLRPNGSLAILLSDGTTPLLNADALFTAGGPDLTPQSVKITKLPTAGKLLLNGSAIQAGQLLTPADFANITYSAPKSGVYNTFSYNISDGTNFATSDAILTITSSATPLLLLGNNTPISNNTAPSATNFTDFGTWTTFPDLSLQSDTRTYSLTNTSTASINLANLTLTGPNAADFTLTNPPANLTLAPGAQIQLTLQFLPKAVGKHLAALSIPNATEPLIIQLTGTGVASQTVHTDPAGAGGIVQTATTQPSKQKTPGASNGQILTVTYTAYLADGTVVDSSAAHASSVNGLIFRLDDNYTANQPFLNKDSAFSIENTNVDVDVIAGWEFGLQGIKPGEKRTLLLNAAAAYGSTGAANIPADATLRFDVQAISILTKPELAVAFNSTPLTPLASGQTAVSALNGTLLSLSANQSSTSEKFSLLSIFSDNANGTPLSNISISSLSLSGPNAKNFSLTRIGNTLTLTFHPSAPGARNAVVHIHSSDPLHKDFTFAVQGTSPAVTDLALSLNPTHFPTTPITAGSKTKLTLPLKITNTGNTPITTKYDLQIYAHNTATNTDTLLQTLSTQSLPTLKPAASHPLSLTLTIPATLLAGTYQLRLVLVDRPPFTESSTTNNTATTPQSIVVKTA